MLFKLKKKLVSIIFQTGRFVIVCKPKYKNNCWPVTKVVIKALFCSLKKFEGCDKNLFILLRKSNLHSQQTNKLNVHQYLGASVEDTTLYM